ncbi:MAG: hypothetical protein WD036_07375 [Bauldia sp.]
MDNTRLSIVALAALPIAVALVGIARRRHRLGLLHLHVLLLALSYGAYTVVDMLVTDVAGIDVLAVAALMLALVASILVLLAVHARLSAGATRRVSVENFVGRVNAASYSALIGIWLAAAAWHAYSYLAYGIVSFYDQQELARYAIFIPSWHGPVNELFVSLEFAVFIWLVASISAGAGSRLLVLRLAMLTATVMLLSLGGRREFLVMLIVGGVVWLVGRGKIGPYFTVGLLARGAVALAVAVLFSNLFQNVRIDYLTYSPRAGVPSSSVSFIDALFDIDATLGNLKARTALWRFHYAIMEEQLNDPTNVMGGELVWHGLVGAIPRVFSPGKIVYSDDVLVCQYFAAICPNLWASDIDYPQTVYSGLQADFGFPFIVLTPIWIFGVLWVVGVYDRLAKWGRIPKELYIVVFGFAAHLLVDIEQSVGSYFIFLRDIAILTVCFVALDIVVGRLGKVGRAAGRPPQRARGTNGRLVDSRVNSR